MRNKTLKKVSIASLATMMALSAFGNSAINISAKEGIATRETDPQGYNVLGSVVSVTKDGNVIMLNISTGERVRFTFLEENVFRMYMAPEGSEFKEYPTPSSKDYTATITNKTDGAYQAEYNVDPELVDNGDSYSIKTSKITIEIKKANTLMKTMKADGTVVWEETAPLKYKNSGTVQTLKTDKNEYFYGGGTQNGRFSHKGNIINVENEGDWVDQGVASPNPFYWSTDGYGVVRNTWQPGKYDFAKTDANSITTTHNEKRFDAYYFIDDQPAEILNDFYELTGNPVELPEYASYLGHLNCYNRDYWTEVPKGTGGAVQMGDKWYRESKTADGGGQLETLLGEENTTAQQVIEDHKANDMPLGWFLPNDGYGCGYGQTPTQEGDIKSLEKFSNYAIANGIQTGLWTQNNLWPADASNPQKGERDIFKEVKVGVHAVKTDVAWVGPGYAMALNSVSVAYNAIAQNSNMKPNIVSLNGWAGTQRYAGIWTGDQYGGQWEYIRFHIPTYIGTSLSGQPNIGSDMDGIFGGNNPKIATRDFQWKAFTTFMLDMDGWGSNAKNPWSLGEDGTSINRSYLKLKAKLAPYTNTISHTATALGELPMIRAMFLEEKNDYTLGKATEYQYMYGDNFLVAPVYQETAADAAGNDIRNNIYLPGTSDVWIDYFTGEQHRGGQVLNNFDAPLWKLPLFVKNGAIIPMYPENNNPEEKTEVNVDGLDRSQRIVEFYPHGDTEFKLYEDDGKTLGGASSTTTLKSSVQDGTATLEAEMAIGKYEGMVKERSNEFIVNVSQAPGSVEGTVAGKDVTFTKVNTQEEYDAAEGNVYFYNEAPSVFVKQFASEGSTYENIEDTTTPKIYVKSTEKVDVTANGFKVVIKDFKNEQDLGRDELNETIAIPEGFAEIEKKFNSIKVGWNAVAGAETYDVEVDGIVYRNNKTTNYTQKELKYLTDHTFRVRTVTDDGYSNWTDLVTIQTADNPYRNVPAGMSGSFENGEPPKAYSGAFENMFDEDNKSEYSSAAGGAWKDQSIILDMKKSYQMDKFEYICRQNMANGAVQKFHISYSNDGMSWKDYGDITNNVADSVIVEGNEDGRQFIHTFSNKFNARYLRITVKQSTGFFLQAYAIRPYFVDGTKGKVVGDVNNSGGIENNDLTFYENYMGITPIDSDYQYVTQSVIGDIDNNEMIDAYDISYVARQLGEPVTKPAKGVDGKIQLIPSKKDIKAGDVFTVDVYGIGLKNVNAFSVEIPVDNDLFSTGAASASVSSIFMRNLSQERKHSSETLKIDNYVSFVNVGQQQLINGTGSLAKVTVTAKNNFTWDTKETQAVLVGQDLSKVDAMIDITQVPVAPITKKTLGLSDIKSISFDNDVKQNMDGSTLWHQANWKDILFDGVTAGSLAEFKWFQDAATFPEEVKLPTDMKFTFNKVEPLTKIKVHNRASGNGSVTKIKATGYKGDKEYDLGSFTGAEAVFEFTVPKEATDGIDRVVITPQESIGSATGATTGGEKNRMLSLHEIEFETDSAVNATSIAFNDSSVNRTTINSLAEVSAKVAPSNVSNPFYSVTSSDESIAHVIKVPTETTYYYVIQGMSAGSVTLTATSEDGNFTDTMEFTVIDGVDTSKLDTEIAKIDDLYANLYTEASYEAVLSVVEEAKALIEKPGVTQSEIDKITASLAKSIKELEFKGSNKDQADSVNIIDQKTMTKYDESSFATTENDNGSNTIDGKSNTIWHSNYSGSYQLPQYVTIDLGANYMLEQINMLARQGSSNGHIIHYRIEVSTDEGDDKKFVPVVEGYFDNNGTSLEEPGDEKLIKIDKTEARYVRFIAIESLGGTKNAYASIAELNFFGKTATSELDKALADAEKVFAKEEKYTTSSFANFSAKYDAAVAVSEKEDATADEIKLAIINLKQAKQELATKAEADSIASITSKVAEYKALEANYTVEEFAAMKKAITEAEAILVKDLNDISVFEASMANIRLLDAYLKLKDLASSETLLDNLKYMISSANEILADEGVADLRPGQVKALKDAVKTGQKLIDENSEDRIAIMNASTAILAATNELWVIYNKEELSIYVAYAEGLTGNFTEESKMALADAIKEAKEIIANDDATEIQVKAAKDKLEAAIKNLVVMANKDALALQISFADSIIANIDNYISSTVNGLDVILAEAKAVYENEAATQADVNDMTKKLTDANMKARTKADKTALADIIEKAKKYDLNKYTLESATNLENTLSNAKIVMNNESATAEEIEFSVKAVNLAISGLTEKSIGDNTGGNGNSNGSNNGANTGSGSGSNTSNGVNTGDETNIGGVMAMLTLAGCAILAVARKKAEQE